MNSHLPFFYSRRVRHRGGLHHAELSGDVLVQGVRSPQLVPPRPEPPHRGEAHDGRVPVPLLRQGPQHQVQRAAPHEQGAQGRAPEAQVRDGRDGDERLHLQQGRGSSASGRMRGGIKAFTIFLYGNNDWYIVTQTKMQMYVLRWIPCINLPTSGVFPDAVMIRSLSSSRACVDIDSGVHVRVISERFSQNNFRNCASPRRKERVHKLVKCFENLEK